MTQEQLVKNFLNGAQDGASSGAGNLKIQGNLLIHYQTIISERCGDKFILNVTRYSIVTGRIQKILRENIPENILLTAHKVPEGTNDSLLPFVKNS